MNTQVLGSEKDQADLLKIIQELYNEPMDNCFIPLDCQDEDIKLGWSVRRFPTSDLKPQKIIHTELEQLFEGLS